MGDEEIEIEVVVHVPERDAHARLRPAGVVQGDARQKGVVGETAPALIQPELVRLAVVRYIEVEAPVAVEVVADDAQPRRVHGAESGRERDVLESSAPQVAVEIVVDPGEDLRTAVVTTAVLLGAELPRIVPHVAGDVEVEAPVGVVVAKRRRGRPSRTGHAGRSGHVLETPVAEVPVEDVRPVVGDEQVGAAVPVEVRGSEAHSVPAVGGSRGGARVGERSQ